MRTRAATARRGLVVRTYDVIPLTPSLGMMAYVGGTLTLEEAITKHHVPKYVHVCPCTLYTYTSHPYLGGSDHLAVAPRIPSPLGSRDSTPPTPQKHACCKCTAILCRWGHALRELINAPLCLHTAPRSNSLGFLFSTTGRPPSAPRQSMREASWECTPSLPHFN